VIAAIQIAFGIATAVLGACTVHYYAMATLAPERFIEQLARGDMTIGRRLYFIAVIVGTFVFGASGFYALFWWIPESLRVVVEDGERTSSRLVLALLCGIFAIPLAGYFEQSARNAIALRALRTKVDELEKPWKRASDQSTSEKSE
jgi:hypothetical protein